MPNASHPASCTQAQRPRSQVIDEAVVLGNRDKHIRRNDLALAFPSHQCLDSADLARTGPHDWLVAQQEFSVLHRLEHALLNAELFVQAMLQLRRIDAVAIFALRLGVVHGKVGAPEELRGGPMRIIPEGKPDARGDTNLATG